MGDDAGLMFVIERADTDVARSLQDAFFADIANRYPAWDPGLSQSADPSDLAPPTGVWVVAYLDGRPVGCGGLKAFDTRSVEIRRVFIDESARGLGIGRILLAELETHARLLDYERVRLTTGDRQPESLSLFQSAGYAEIPPFNGNVFARHWMEKLL